MRGPRRADFAWWGALAAVFFATFADIFAAFFFAAAFFVVLPAIVLTSLTATVPCPRGLAHVSSTRK